MKRDASGCVVFLLAIVTDDILMSGKEEALYQFDARVKSSFKVSKVKINGEIFYNGFKIYPN